MVHCSPLVLLMATFMFGESPIHKLIMNKGKK